MTGKIPVNEVFGPVIQGEGAMIGTKVVFIRTGGCDYQCAWCDSKFTWDGTEKHNLLDPSQILQLVRETGGENFDWITISGGNPVLIGEPMAQFIQMCHEQHYRISVETQGSVWQDWLTMVDELVISPKPPSSLMRTNFASLAEYVQALREHKTPVSLKVVVFDDTDYEYARAVKALLPGVPFYLQVGNENVSTADDLALTQNLLSKLRWLMEKVLGDPDFNDARVLPQLHALVYGNRRKV